jgi:hypothetical protein
MAVKEINITSLQRNLAYVRKLLKQGYQLQLKDFKTDELISIMMPVNNQDNKSMVDLTDVYGDNAIDLTEEEKTNIYEVFTEDPSQYNTKPVARYRN